MQMPSARVSALFFRRGRLLLPVLLFLGMAPLPAKKVRLGFDPLLLLPLQVKEDVLRAPTKHISTFQGHFPTF
jgi:hypothetical protein